MKYFLSPEFHRNLWLRFSPTRIIAVQVVIALLAYIAVTGHPDAIAETLMQGSLTGYGFIVLLWGNYEAATALQDEIKGKTWDTQRMSPLTPGQLAFGKLFGATSFVWYIGIILLAIFVCSYSHYVPHANRGYFNIINHPVTPEAAAPDTPGNILLIALFMVLAGLAGQVTAFLMSVADFASARSKLGRLYIPKSIFPFIVSVAVSESIFGPYAESSVVRFPNVHPAAETVTWFGAEFDHKTFALASIAFFLMWGLAGIYRTVRAELMYPQTPVAWGLAVLTIAFYAAGFMDTHQVTYPEKVSAYLFTVFVFAAYASMLLEAADIEKCRRFLSYLRQRNLQKTLQNMPRWVSLLGFIALSYFFTLGICQHNFSSVLSLLTGIILFSVRDGMIVHATYMGSEPRYVPFYLGFYYVLAYYILPMLYFSVSGGNILQPGGIQSLLFPVENGGNTVDGLNLATFFYPVAADNALFGILPVAVETALAWLWLERRKKALVSA